MNKKLTKTATTTATNDISGEERTEEKNGEVSEAGRDSFNGIIPNVLCTPSVKCVNEKYIRRIYTNFLLSLRCFFSVKIKWRPSKSHKSFVLVFFSIPKKKYFPNFFSI